MEHLEIYAQETKLGQYQLMVHYNYGGVAQNIPLMDRNDNYLIFNNSLEALAYAMGKERNGAYLDEPETIYQPGMMAKAFYQSYPN